MPEVSEHTASMFIEDEHSVEDGFASGEATRKSQEERLGTLVSEEPAEDDSIMELAQKLQRALLDMGSTQLHSEEPQRNNRDKSYDDEQAMEFQVLVMSLPNGSEALSQWLEKETIQQRRASTDDDEDEDTRSFNSVDSMKYYRGRRSSMLSSEEETRPGPEA